MSKDNDQSDQEQEVFVISVAAEITGMHAQTLRTYDRMGLVTPRRTRGGGRRYSQDDIDQLLEIQRLSHEEGVNLAGIQRIIDLEARLATAEGEISALRSRLRPKKGGNYKDTPPVAISTTAAIADPVTMREMNHSKRLKIRSWAEMRVST